MRSPTKSNWVSATRRSLNPSPLWGGSAERSGGRGGGSARQCANNHFPQAAPHPSHRSLRSRCATLPTRGREKRRSLSSQKDNPRMDIKVRDSNGALLAEGDSVTLIKDLKLKGSSTVLKRGTMIKGTHLTDNADEIEGRTDKVKGLVLRTEFLKKA